MDLNYIRRLEMIGEHQTCMIMNTVVGGWEHRCSDVRRRQQWNNGGRRREERDGGKTKRGRRYPGKMIVVMGIGRS